MSYENDLEQRCVKLEEAVERLEEEKIKKEYMHDKTLDSMFNDSLLKSVSTNNELIDNMHWKEIIKLAKCFGFTSSKLGRGKEYRSKYDGVVIVKLTFKPAKEMTQTTITLANGSTMVMGVPYRIEECWISTGTKDKRLIAKNIKNLAGAIAEVKNISRFHAMYLVIQKYLDMKSKVCDTPTKE
jgi:hypothetical protein